MASRFATPLDPFTLSRAKRGDLRAQESIYRQYERAVYSLARRMSDQVADAEEITQDVFVSAFSKMAEYRSDSPFGYWLRSITVNHALMRRRNKPSTAIDDASESHACRMPVQMDLANALARLPQPTRGILWLYYVEGFSHQEIADLHSQSLSFSKSQVARGTERLRAAFHEEPHTFRARAAL